MPLSSDLGLVYGKDFFSMGARVHWIEFEIELEQGKGLNVFGWPATDF